MGKEAGLKEKDVAALKDLWLIWKEKDPILTAAEEDDDDDEEEEEEADVEAAAAREVVLRAKLIAKFNLLKTSQMCVLLSEEYPPAK